MKKSSLLLIVLALIAGIAAVSCHKNSSPIVVGASSKPHSELLMLVQPDLQAQGYNLVVKDLADTSPNQALQNGDIDVSIVPAPFIEEFDVDNNGNLVSAGVVYIEPMALYSSKYDSIDSLPDGALIAIPNDQPNEGRALLLLQTAGLIQLKDGAGLDSTPADIASNPRNIQFQALDEATITQVYSDNAVDAAVIDDDDAIDTGLDVNSSLIAESASSPFVNVIAVKQENQNNPAVQALVKALQSEKVKNYIVETYPNGDVMAVF